MKVKVTETETIKAFEPVTLSITIETEEELLDLYHRTSIDAETILRGYAIGHRPRGLNDDSCQELFNQLNGILIDDHINAFEGEY